jgi:hypothetical protein
MFPWLFGHSCSISPISVSLHGFASADWRHGRCDHDPTSHVLILLPGERSGSQFVCGIVCQSVRQVVFGHVGSPLQLRNEFVGDLRSDFEPFQDGVDVFVEAFLGCSLD